nr:MAG TPA: hypothetical protein [Caudoviricetes sp.]
MKSLTKLKLRLEVVLKAVNLDWREVALELMNDLIKEQQNHFASKQEIYDLKQQLAIYKEKEQGEQYV